MQRASRVDHPKFSGFDSFYSSHEPTMRYMALKCKDITASWLAEKEISCVIETTIGIVINDRYRVNILCTASQLEAMVTGYLITEGLVSSLEQLETIEYRAPDLVHVTTGSVKDFFYWTELRTSGCVGIKQQHESLDVTIDSAMTLDPETIFRAQEAMVARSRIWPVAGGSHMTALFHEDGRLACFAEDVGRHNTVDKVVGEAAILGLDTSKMHATTSGRLSAAMVSKMARARVPIFISNTAPMAQGIEIARKVGITLVGFTRRPELNVYTGFERVVPSLAREQ